VSVYHTLVTMIIVEHPLAGGIRARPRSDFSLWLTRVNLFLCVVFCFSFSELRATYFRTEAGNVNTVTQSATGITASMTITFNSTTGVATWHHVQSGNGGGAWVTHTTGSGGAYGSPVIHDHSPGSAEDHTGTWNPTVGSWWQIAARVSGTDGNLYDTIGYWQAGSDPEYYADFKIPVNLGTKSVSVKFYQNGTLKASYTASPGGSVQDVHLTGLAASGTVFAVYGYGEYSYDTSGNITYTADKVFLPAGQAEPTAAAEPPEPTWLNSIGTPGGAKPAVKPAVVPVAPKTPETNVPAPTAVAQPSAPTVINKHVRVALGIPFASPSGTAGVTKQDAEVVANAVVGAMDTHDSNRAAEADKQIDATNNVASTIATQTNAQLSALNSLRTETATGTNKQVAVGNGLQAAIEGLRGDVRAGNATLDSMNLTLGEIELNTKPPSETDAAASMSNIVSTATDFMDSVSEATEVQPSKGTVASDDATGGAGMPDVVLPGSAAGGHSPVSMSLNPLHHPKVALLAGLIRALIGWAVLFALISWTYIQIPIWMTEALKGGSGFTAWRAAVGAVPLVGLAVLTVLVLAGGAVMLTAPTIMWAYADPLMMGASTTALVDIRSVITSYGGEDAGLMISILDSFCPTGLCMTAAFNYITLRIGGQAICAALIAFSKVLAS